jgi:hypothetical protein
MAGAPFQKLLYIHSKIVHLFFLAIFLQLKLFNSVIPADGEQSLSMTEIEEMEVGDFNG